MAETENRVASTPVSTTRAARFTARPGAARVGRALSWVMVALMAGTSTAGLAVPDLYRDPTVIIARTRGADLAVLVLLVPLLAWSTWAAGRDQAVGTLTWCGVLGFNVYLYPFIVFGAEFNHAFLAHLALLALSMYGLVFALVGIDAPALAAQFRPRTPARWVAGLLLVVAATMISVWGWNIVQWSVSGALPTEALPVPIEHVHLSYVMDAAVLAPAALLAGLLLWRRRPWGYVAGAVVSIALALIQVVYLSMQAFVHAADVPGVAWVDVAYLPFIALMVAAAAAMLYSARGPTLSPEGGRANARPLVAGQHRSR